MDKIDILLATYNGGPYLRAQLDSLFSQEYTAFRIIARDDGSVDDTKDILAEYKEKYPDKIELIVDETPTGSARGNFFRMLSFSEADYVMFCDQDDVWVDTKIEKTLEAMKRAEQEYGADCPVLVHTDLMVADDELRIIDQSLFHMQSLDSSYNTLNRMVAQNNITGCTVMINRPLKEMFRPADNILMHDWWFGLVAAAFGHIAFLPESTVLYRQHDENEVGAKDVTSTAYIRNKLSDRDGIRKLIADTYVQAHAFMETYDDVLTDEQKELLKEYINLHYYGFWKRLASMTKNHFFKSGVLRKLGQAVFG